MKKYVALSGAVFVLLAGLSVAVAQQSKTRAIEQYTCKDVMRESGTDRDVAIAFLHGFILGKSGNSRFDLDLLHKHSSEFIERCLDNPGERALDVMAKVKG
jgi:hypothetical protein